MKRIAFLLTVFITIGMLTENQAQSTKVLMKTSMGDITLMLYDDTPGHRDNFIKLVKSKFYDGLLFHRVIPGFMVQGGDPATRASNPGQQLPTFPAEIKANHYHKKGALAAARMKDEVNPSKASSGSQFYIVTGRVWTTTDLENLEIQGKPPKFTDEQKKVYTTVGGAASLDMNYTVFGEVTKGMDVAVKIGMVPRKTNDGSDRPLTDVKIISITVVK